MRVAIYVRVSTEDQAREGYSLDAQVKRLRSYCTLRTGWDVVDVYRDEGFSGRNTNRPEYQRMMSDIDKWDTILVLKMDRIHRNSVHFTEMMSHLNSMGKNFNSVMEKFDTTTAMGRFVMDIMQRMAQLESEQIGERVKVAMTKKAENGDGPMGSGEPYGYRYADGKLVVIESEANVVERIFNLRASGYSLRMIADTLNISGVPSKTGIKWSRQALWRILRNPLYVGKIRWDNHTYDGNTPAIVSERVYSEVNGSEEE